MENSSGRRSSRTGCHSLSCLYVRGHMNILIAGATGAAGQALIPRLKAKGHTVTGTTRNPEKFAELQELGAIPQLMDGLDKASVQEAVNAADPDVIVHQMTALRGVDMRNPD